MQAISLGQLLAANPVVKLLARRRLASELKWNQREVDMLEAAIKAAQERVRILQTRQPAILAELRDIESPTYFGRVKL